MEGSATNSSQWGGGAQLPLLCSLVLDKVISGLSESGCYTMGHIDHTTILRRGKIPKHCLRTS
jgi:hypothetical protein